MLAALTCLLLSDGVGPRLLPYPSNHARLASHIGVATRPFVAPLSNTQRERALIALEVKLDQLKTAGDSSRSAADEAENNPRQLAARFALVNERAVDARTPCSLSNHVAPARLRGPPPSNLARTI